MSILLCIFLLLIAGLIVAVMLYVGTADKLKKMTVRAEISTAEQEALQKEMDEILAQLGEASQKVTDAEEAAAAARQETTAVVSALQEAQNRIEVLETEAKLDVGLLSAGTVIPQTELDLTDPAFYFRSYEIQKDDAVYRRINGKSYVENPNIGLENLRYLKLLHYNFDHEIQVGELIVAADLAEDYLEIFLELFRQEYEIYSMFLIDDFWTGEGNDSDTASCDANNTSAFCYRAITGGGELSNHAFGRAIDINPQQNPYVNYSRGYPVWFHENANDYIDRNTGYDHVITHEDLCYQLFTAHGFSWGGDWEAIKDYQHFEMVDE